MSLNNSSDGGRVVIDEILCFIFNKMDTVDPFTMNKICCDFYSEESILCSKNMLVAMYPNPNERIIKRQGPKKSSLNIDDIIKVFQTNKKNKEDNPPVFVAKDLANLPPLTFESLDVSALLHTMKKCQEEVSHLKEAVSLQTTTCSDLKEVCSSQNERLNKVEKKIGNPGLILARTTPGTVSPRVSPTKKLQHPKRMKSGSPEAASNIMEKEWRDLASEEKETNLSQDLENDKGSSMLIGSKMSESSTGMDNNKIIRPLYPNLQEAGLTEDLPSEHQQPDENILKWSQVVRKRNRNRKQENGSQENALTAANHNNGDHKPSQRPPVVRGSGIIDNIKGVQRRTHIYAGRFEPNLSADVLKSHLEAKLNIVVTCSKISKSDDQMASSSFHIMSNGVKPDVFYDPGIWPEGVIVRRYLMPKFKMGTVSVVANGANIERQS